MARADSTIRVNIIGDARQLVGTLKGADKAVGGMGSTLLKGAIALGVINEGFKFAKTATAEADRLGDATERLNIQLGDLAGPLESTASGFRKIGASSQDMLELEANFADMATGAGIADENIAGMAEQVAATATAASLLSDVDAATIVSSIGRASQDSIKPLLALGVHMTDAEVAARALAMTGKDTADSLTDGELAAARIAIALEQLKPKLDAATTGTGDLEQSQRQLDAAAEELQAKLGGPLSDALLQVTSFINDEIDAIPSAIAGWQMLGATVENFGRTVLGPLGNVRDVLESIVNLLHDASGQTRSVINDFDERDMIQAVNNNAARNNLERSQGK